MAQHLFFFSIFFGYLLDIVLLLCSFIFCYKKLTSKFIKIFPLFAIANIISDVNTLKNFFFRKEGHETLYQISDIIFFLLLLFEIIFFTYILFQLIQSALAKRVAFVMNILFSVSFILSIASLFIHRNNNNLTTILFLVSILFESLSIIMLCLIFFIEILKKPYTKELTKLQPFWMVTGILFYFSLRLPAFLFSSYFGMQQNILLANVILSIYNYSEIIPYALFIKSMTCRIKQ